MLSEPLVASREARARLTKRLFPQGLPRLWCPTLTHFVARSDAVRRFWPEAPPGVGVVSASASRKLTTKDVTTISGSETCIPTFPKSYHKINTGPFVRTPFGLRLLRQAEIERIHGCRLLARHYATAVQMLGQGVQTQVFRHVFDQLGSHLAARLPALTI